MNAEFFSAIEDLEKEKGIPRDYMYDKIRQAMLAAFRRDNPECAMRPNFLVSTGTLTVSPTFARLEIFLAASI